MQAEIESTGGEHGREPGNAGGLRRSATELTSRIEEIVDAAERAAIDIRREAEESGERYLAERRREADRLLGEQSRRFAKGTASLRDRAREFAELAEGVATMAEEVLAALRELTPPPAQPEIAAAPGARHPTSPDPAALSEPEFAAPAKRIPEAALLRVTQMAIAGRNRDEIRDVVAREFGVDDDVHAAVDEILGAG